MREEEDIANGFSYELSFVAFPRWCTSVKVDVTKQRWWDRVSELGPNGDACMPESLLFLAGSVHEKD